MAVLQIVSHPHMQSDNSLMITIPANIPWMLTKCMGHRFAGGGGGSKITADGDCSHETERCLLLGRKAVTNLDSILKSRDVTLLTKVRLVRAMVFPVVMYGGESWTTKDEVITCTSVQFSSFAQLCAPWTAAHQPPCPPTRGVYSNSCPSSQ